MSYLGSGKRHHVSSAYLAAEARKLLKDCFPWWDRIKGTKFPFAASATVESMLLTPALIDAGACRLRLLNREDALKHSHAWSRPARLQLQCRSCAEWFSTGNFNQHREACHASKGVTTCS